MIKARRVPNHRLSRNVGRQGDIMTVMRMDNVGIVVADIDAAIEFFTELGLDLEGRATVEGDWADGVAGLRDMRVEIAMMRTPDGHSRLELSRFLAPPVVADHRSAPVNALGYLRVMFTVEDIDDTLDRLGKRGAKLVGEVVWSGTKTCIGSATSGVLKESSSGWSNSSGSRFPERIPWDVTVENLRSGVQQRYEPDRGPTGPQSGSAPRHHSK